MEKVARFMEFFWLALALVTGGWAVYVLCFQGWNVGRTWLLFPAVCVAMWGYRRFMRGKVAEWAERERQRTLRER
jgi:hypothetical protein